MPNKIIDLEVLKSFRQRLDNRYVQQVGYIPGLHVGIADLAKQIENVSEKSGTTQTKSFTLQATATDSNTTSTPTAPLAKHLELRGNSVAFNQLCKTTRGSESVSGITITNNGDGSVSISGTAGANVTWQVAKTADRFYLIEGHTYLIKGCPKNISDTRMWDLRLPQASMVGYDTGDGVIGTALTSGLTSVILGVTNGADIQTPITFYPQIFDLTLMFNGDIPTEILNGFDIELGDEDETTLHISGVGAFNQLFRKATYPYNAGELKSCESTKLISVGYNQFDEELEGNRWSNTDESSEASAGSFRSKNFIPVIAGQKYTIGSDLLDGTSHLTLYQYNGDKKLISYNIRIVDGSYDYIMSENTQYIRFAIYKSGSGWASDVPTKATAKCFINLTWDKSKTGYEEYSKEEYDLPTLVLNSACDAYDELTPNGTLTRRVGTYDLCNLLVSQTVSAYGVIQINVSSLGIKANTSYSTKANISCDKYIVDNYSNVYSATTKKSIAFVNDTIAIQDDDFIGQTASDIKIMLGSLNINFELATPTTTQNDAYAYTENIVVDDFGTMEFNSDIPQGNKFFYPADYVLLLDDLNNYVNGDVTNLVTQSDLTSALENVCGDAENLTDEYDSTRTYALGDLVIHDNVLYKCTTAITTAESWNSTHWTATTIENEFATKNYFGFKVINAPESTTLTDDEYNDIVKGVKINGTFLNLRNPTIFPTYDGGGYLFGLIVGQTATGWQSLETQIRQYLLDKNTKSININNDNERIGLYQVGVINGRKLIHYLNNVYPYATNSTTTLQYETINNISISANTTFTLATAPTNTYPEYKANITNTDNANAITITLTGVSKIKTNDSNITIVEGTNSTFTIPASASVELNIQNGKAIVFNWEA